MLGKLSFFSGLAIYTKLFIYCFKVISFVFIYKQNVEYISLPLVPIQVNNIEVFIFSVFVSDYNL